MKIRNLVIAAVAVVAIGGSQLTSVGTASADQKYHLIELKNARVTEDQGASEGSFASPGSFQIITAGEDTAPNTEQTRQVTLIQDM